MALPPSGFPLSSGMCRVPVSRTELKSAVTCVLEGALEVSRHLAVVFLCSWSEAIGVGGTEGDERVVRVGRGSYTGCSHEGGLGPSEKGLTVSDGHDCRDMIICDGVSHAIRVAASMSKVGFLQHFRLEICLFQRGRIRSQ